MKHLAAAVLLCLPVMAQGPSNPISADLKSAWNQIKGYVARSADKMPEDQYSFKPAPEVRSYGQLLGHIADAQYMICGAARGEQKMLGIEKSKTTKAELIAALAESNAYCDAVYDAMTDASGAEMVKLFGRERSRMGALQLNIAHDYEHYGNLVTYMRMKGLVPPSSERR